jgi:hypothetical protein
MAYQRKTEDVWGVFGLFEGKVEEVFTATTYQRAREVKRDYTRNDSHTPYHVRMYRLKIGSN